MVNQTFLTFIDFEFGIEILVYMYVLYVFAYGVFGEICRTKKLWGLYVDMKVWLQCHNIYGTCSPILNICFFRTVLKN
jgi:hypothetical protein